MRFFSARVGLILGIFILVLLGIVYFYNQNKITTTLQLSYQNNFSQTATLPLSSFNKLGIIETSKNNKTVFWQDGMFLYRTDVNNQSPVTPYALIGQVKAVSGRYFEIVPYSRGKTLFNSAQKITIQLLEENSDVASLQRKDGKVISNLYAYTLIKTGDIVEVHSLKPVGKDSYTTTQIFVLLK